MQWAFDHFYEYLRNVSYYIIIIIIIIIITSDTGKSKL